jgi:hypothetical protein
MTTKVRAKFHPGETVAATPAVIEKVDSTYAGTCLNMHLRGNWGLVDEEDWKANDRAIKDGGRILSVYPLPNDPGNFWIITEAKDDTGTRAATTFLLPSEY